MNSNLRSILSVAAFAALAGSAQGAVVTLQWVTTIAAPTTVPGSVVGESYTTTIRVDNGGSSVLSQTWTAANFLSFRQEGASGWWFESTEINLNPSLTFGAFSTDALGTMLTAGNWGTFDLNFNVLTSWAGAELGGWWNNGNNATSCAVGILNCVRANNVNANVIGSSWTAALESGASVPEPASFALVGMALLAAGMASRRRC